MKSSLALVLAGSLLAAAKPIDKRAIFTDYVTDIVTVTVTVDESADNRRPNFHIPTHSRPAATVATTSSSSSSFSSSSSSSSSFSSPSTAPVVVPTTSVYTPPAPSTTSVYITPVYTPPAPSTTSIYTPPVPSTTSVYITPVYTPPAPSTTAIVTPTTSSAPIAIELLTTEVEAAVATPTVVYYTTSEAEPTTAEAKTTTQAKTSTEAKAKATSTSTSASTAEPTDYSSTAVYHHNIHRSNHSAPAASWDSDLTSYAATVASSCVYGHDLTPGGGGYGQNIAMAGSSSASASDDSSTYVAQAITDMWYNGEVWQFPSDGYGQDSPDMTDFEAWGHFSQVVWVESTKVGCASQFCAAGTMNADMAAWFTVCNYQSAGNVEGEYGSNVLPSLGQSSVTA